MKRWLCILLCVLLLVPSVAILSSCKKEEAELDVSKKTVEISLDGYKMVKTSGMSTLLTELVQSFVTDLHNATGVAIKLTNDKEAVTVSTEDLEILIGDTRRTETEKAMKDISGYGWVIRVFDNKLVIAGSNNALTVMAVQYLTANYLPADRTSGTLTLPQKTVMSNVSMLAIEGEEQSSNFSVVYDADLDDTNGSDGGTDSNIPANPDQVDIPVAVARTCASEIVSLTGIKARTLQKKTDKAEQAGQEIQVGIVNRESCKTALASIGADEYGVFAINGDLVVTSWTDAGVQLAGAFFTGLLADCWTVTEDGSKKLLFPEGLRFVNKTNTAWVSDFPKPAGEGIELCGASDIADDSLLYYYEGEGVSAAAFESYCETLVAAGYTLYSSNTREGSIYRTYNNASKKHTLYAVYAAFSHREEQNVSRYKPSIRVISAPLGSVNLVKEELLTAGTWTRIADSSITTVRLAYPTGNFGMNYVIMLEDGSFIVYDGGGDGQTNAANDHVKLYDVLTDLFRQAHGGALPSKDDPLVISAWIMTHQHWDHYAVFADFCEVYGGQMNVRIEGLYANYISTSEAFNTYNPDSSIMKNFTRLEDYTNGTMKYYKLHSGMKLYIKNAELEVLYTHEDLYPQRLDYFNDSSTVVRFTIHNSEGGKDVTATFLGDLYQKGSKAIRSLFGNTIKSDIVQVAHHGYNAVEKELYQLFAPELLLWPTSSKEWRDQTKASNKTSGNWFFKIDYYIANELSSVKYIVVQDVKNTTITLGVNGPDYENIYCPADGGYEAGAFFQPKDDNSLSNYLIKK